MSRRPWQRHLTGERAIATLIVLTAAYEYAAPENQLISHAVDRYLETHRWATVFAIAYTAAHLLNLIPPRLDLYHLVGKTIGS
ncbi:hypothetical protein IU485_27720 [Nocardia cyriacigeorgica]|uniref:DUF7427 family protein n=1 Tax=Nocardia cyriacigeorgica TaxID=135487 RepID=UPI001892DBCB|nr:hypothetical protein [Nocardia cyriacigeorgica]MBF6085166.1 hypothetical protein [Nocardia cyriacigeorgica]